MNRLEVIHFLKKFFTGLGKTGLPQGPGPGKKQLIPFLDMILSLKQDLPLSIPLLRDLAGIVTADTAASNTGETGIVRRRLERCYLRLCRISGELGALDLKKAASGAKGSTALEDFVFSQIDFSRYRSMDEKEFESLFPEGIEDFDEALFKKNFGLQRQEIQSVIEGSYKKNEGKYRLQRETPLILSVMRTLETSLQTVPLFTAEEITEELKKLLDFLEGSGEKGRHSGERPGNVKLLPGMEQLYPLLVTGLDNVQFTHGDGMTTKLFISPRGDLSGTFRPGNKPWTLVLIDITR